MSKLRVGYVARNIGSVLGGRISTAKSLMENTGANTGNLAFLAATRELFDEEIILVSNTADGRAYRDQIEKLVIPAANFLNPAWNFRALGRFIEDLGKECLVFGLGAQAQSEMELPALQEGTVHFLRAAASHARTLFVRGNYTAEVCNRYGVTNTEPTGCPSITLNGAPDLGRLISSRIGAPMERLYAAGASFKSENALLERELFRLVGAHAGSTYCIQCPEGLITLADGKVDGLIPIPLIAQTAHQVLDSESEFGEFSRRFSRLSRYFWDVPTWVKHASLHSYSIGTRIHGAIISAMAGVPTLVAGHDARIRELCEAMLLPCKAPAEIARDLCCVPRLFEQLEFKGSNFDDRRMQIARTYHDYIQESGLTPSRKLACTLWGGGRPTFPFLTLKVGLQNQWRKPRILSPKPPYLPAQLLSMARIA